MITQRIRDLAGDYGAWDDMDGDITAPQMVAAARELRRMVADADELTERAERAGRAEEVPA